MLKAMFKTFTANSTLPSVDLPFDLAGEWLPVRHDEWYNRLPGKHSKRARSSTTKMTYDSNGKGSGWVGEVYVDVQARTIAPGRYTAKFQVRTSSKTLPWSANDGHLSLLEDGTLQVQYPSQGIREYWRRADGCGAQILQDARDKGHNRSRSADNCTRPANNCSSEDAKENVAPTINDLDIPEHFLPYVKWHGGKWWQQVPGTYRLKECGLKKEYINSRRPQRAIKLVFRHFGDSVGVKKDGYLWHWGLQVGDSIYEVNGAMAVMGPNGLVAASSPLVKHVHTDIKQFHGYVNLPHGTRKTDSDIEEFSRHWVKNHPVYRALGPNCQTYTEDLFTFLTGDDLPYAKTADKVNVPGGRRVLEGPESDPNATWLNLSKRPS